MWFVYYSCFVTLSHYNWSNQSDSVVCKPGSRAMWWRNLPHSYRLNTCSPKGTVPCFRVLQILEVHDIHLHYVYKVIHEIYPNYIGFFVHTPKKKWIPNWIMQILRYIGITNNSVDRFHCLLICVRVVLFSQGNFNFIWKPNNAGHFFLCRHSIVNFLCMK